MSVSPQVSGCAFGDALTVDVIVAAVAVAVAGETRGDLDGCVCLVIMVVVVVAVVLVLAVVTAVVVVVVVEVAEVLLPSLAIGLLFAVPDGDGFFAADEGVGVDVVTNAIANGETDAEGATHKTVADAVAVAVAEGLVVCCGGGDSIDMGVTIAADGVAVTTAPPDCEPRSALPEALLRDELGVGEAVDIAPPFIPPPSPLPLPPLRPGSRGHATLVVRMSVALRNGWYAAMTL